MGSTFQALLDICEQIGQTKGGVSSGGSTTTLVDATKGDYPNDYWNDGTLFILSGVNALKTLKITDFETSTGTFTFSAIPYTMESGVDYVVMPALYTRDDLVRALNSALNEVGPLPRYEILTPSEDDKETYLLQGVFNLLVVETSGQVAEPYDWEVNYFWKEVNNRLVFTTGFAPTFTKLRVWYEARHARVDEDRDNISDYIHPDRLAVVAAKCAVGARKNVALNNEPYLDGQWKELQSMADRMSVLHPIHHINPTPHLSTW